MAYKGPFVQTSLDFSVEAVNDREGLVLPTAQLYPKMRRDNRL